MPSPVPRRKCWHDDVGVCCKGTIWQSSMQLESQCASFISLWFFTQPWNWLLVIPESLDELLVEWKSVLFWRRDSFANFPLTALEILFFSRDFHTVHGLDRSLGLLEIEIFRKLINLHNFFSDVYLASKQERIYRTKYFLKQNKKNRYIFCPTFIYRFSCIIDLSSSFPVALSLSLERTP